MGTFQILNGCDENFDDLSGDGSCDYDHVLEECASASDVTLRPTPSPVTKAPTTSSPTKSPSKDPTGIPSESPTPSPTNKPLLPGETHDPTMDPTTAPTGAPTVSPSNEPTDSPTHLMIEEIFHLTLAADFDETRSYFDENAILFEYFGRECIEYAMNLEDNPELSALILEIIAVFRGSIVIEYGLTVLATEYHLLEMAKKNINESIGSNYTESSHEYRTYAILGHNVVVTDSTSAETTSDGMDGAVEESLLDNGVAMTLIAVIAGLLRTHCLVI